MKKINRKIATVVTALGIAASVGAPIAAQSQQPVQASRITISINPYTVGAVLGGAVLAHMTKQFYNHGRKKANMTIAEYNRYARKVNRMHLVQMNQGYNFFYNKRGKMLRGTKKKPLFVQTGTLLKHPKGTRRIHGKTFYYFGHGLYLPKKGVSPYRLPKRKYAPSFGEALGDQFNNMFKGLTD